MGWSKSELNMEQYLVDMLMRQRGILWVDFNDWGRMVYSHLYRLPQISMQDLCFKPILKIGLTKILA